MWRLILAFLLLSLGVGDVAKYSRFKYGGTATPEVFRGAKYGDEVDTMAYLWSIQVAWTGAYTGDNEAGHATGLTITRGRDFLIKPGGNGFEHMQVGEAVITLDNEDRRYDPWYAAGPLYGFLAPGKFAKIKVTDTATGITYDVMYGIVDDIQPIGRNKARLVIKDGLRWLRDNRIAAGWAEEYAGAIMQIIKSEANWPTAQWGNAIDHFSGRFINDWWGRNQYALDAAHDIEDAEFGILFHGRDGLIQFFAHDHDYGAATVITEDEILTDIAIPQPWEVLRNRAKIYAYPKTETGAPKVTLWKLQDTPLILGGGGTFVVEATFNWDSQTVCGSSVDWYKAVWTNADGTGTDITGDIVLTYTAIGDRSTITLTNNNASSGYVTLLRGDGYAIYPPYASSFVYEDAASEALYGYKDFVLDNYWVESSVYAKGYANYVVTKLSDPLMYPTIQIENRSALQFGLDLQALVNLQVASRDIDANLKIGKITHTWLRENGNAVRTTFKLEPYLDPTVGYWTLGTSQLGSTTILGF